MANVAGGSVVWDLDIDTQKLSAGLAKARSDIKGFADSQQSTFQKLGTKMGAAGRTFTAAFTLPIVAGFTLAAKAAIDYESAFAGIRKTVNASEAEFDQLSDNIREIARIAPTSAVELAGIGEIAGQLGVSGVADLTKFISTVADIAVSTNLSAEVAATSFARVANIMQEPITNIDRMASAVVELGNNFETSEAEIVNFATRIAGAGRIAGLTSADIFSIGAAMSSVGVQAEAGGTAVQKVLIAMNTAVVQGNEDLAVFAETAGVSATEFQKFFDEEPIVAFTQFIEGLGEAGDGAINILSDLGLEDQRLIRAFLSLAGATGKQRDAMLSSNSAFAENVALAEEAAKRYATTESQIKILTNNVVDIGISMRDILLPALISVTTALIPLIQKFGAFAEEHPGIIKVGAAFLAVLAVVGPLLLGLAGLISVVGAIGSLFSIVAAVVPVVVAAFIAFLPIILIVTAIIVVIGLLAYAIYKNWDLIKETLASTWEFIKASFDSFITFMSGVWESLVTGFNSFVQFIVGIPTLIATFFTLLYETVVSLVLLIVNSIIQSFLDLPIAIATILGLLAGTIVGVFLVIWEFLSTNIPIWIAAIVLWFNELPGKIALVFTTIYDTLVLWGLLVWEYLTVTIPLWIESVVMWFSALPGRLLAILTDIYNKFVAWGTSVWKYLSTQIPMWIATLVKWFGELPGKIYDSLSELAEKIKSRFVEAWDALVAEISTWPQRLYDWGKNIAEAFVNGVKEGLRGLANAFKDAFNRAKGAIKGDSPPKEGPLKEIDIWGFNIGDAWVGGFQKALNSYVPEFSQELTSAISADDIVGSGNTNNQDVNVYIDSINDEQDINALGREFGYRAGISGG